MTAALRSLPACWQGRLAAPQPGAVITGGAAAPWRTALSRRQRRQQQQRLRSLSPHVEMFQQQEAPPAATTANGSSRYSSPVAQPNSRSGWAPGEAGSSGGGAGPPSDPGLIVTTFKWPAALGGHDVSVCGSFSDWEPLALHRSSAGGDWVRSLALPPGPAYFKYLVDGQWICSPCEQVVANGKGYNNHRLIQPTATFTWRSNEVGGREVLLTGSFNSWAELLPLSPDPATGRHTLRCCLPQGHYHFQYLVDGKWLLCPAQTTALTEQGRLVNSMEVHAPPAFHIYYATGWPGAVLHYRMAAGPDEPEQPWEAVPLHSTASRARPKGGNWLTATVPAMPLPARDASSNGFNGSSGEAAALATGSVDGRVAGLDLDGDPAGQVAPRFRCMEFFVTSGDGGSEDRPGGGSWYRCLHPGGYKLRSGQLRPFPMATQPRVMLVSDLDGTMVGETEDADAATREFGTYWEENAALAGGTLVYNTGRSLGQFQGLLECKRGALPVPDVLITAVGTKIWRLDVEGGTRGTATGTAWCEDQQWSRTLDEGWDLGQVKGVTQDVLNRHQDAAFWLDDGSEHPHRVCISTRADVTQSLVGLIQEGVAQRGLQVKVIVSGTGDWRYVDVTAARAGKLAALEYVRTLYGVHHLRCVAAGDSGNDTLMLGGRNLAIVVGNAQPELVQWVLEQPQEERLVVTDAQLARGILEGLARHGLY